MNRESFIFFKEYKDAVDNLEGDYKKYQFYNLIIDYVFYKKIDNNVCDEVKSMFILIKNKLDKNNKSYWSFEERRSSKYKKWKKEVLKKDNFVCKLCGAKENLVVHHIKQFSTNEELRYDINNGMTLCQKCHQEVHK